MEHVFFGPATQEFDKAIQYTVDVEVDVKGQPMPPVLVIDSGELGPGKLLPKPLGQAGISRSDKRMKAKRL